MRFLLLSLTLLLAPLAATAQQAASLVADRVALTPEGLLIAEGNVEVFFEGSSLRASRVTYSADGDRIAIDGPIVITDADGTVFTATQAELDPQLENGILLGARLVLDRQLQLAAAQIDRAEGRYLQLYRTVATSCQVCGDRAPLWEIRAERVIHDEEAQQLYFRNAQFRVRGLPIAWIPYLRLPDPTLERARGLLVPEQRNTSDLGLGIKLPYFIPIGRSADLTVTPYLAAETRTLEGRYRQAFRNGYLEINGAVSDDTLRPELRAYLDLAASFRLADGTQLAFDVETVSDKGYLAQYGYGAADRLQSEVSAQRISGRDLATGRLSYYETLRDGETNRSLPPIVGELIFERRRAGPMDGLVTWRADLDALSRVAEGSGPDSRDVARLGGEAGWQADRVLAGGLLAEAQLRLRADLWSVTDDAAYPDPLLRAVPQAALALRYPLAAQARYGSLMLLEPVAQLRWSEALGDTPPNEDSTRAEFDRGNLLALSRFPGEDAAETGTELAVGASFTRQGREGVDSTLTLGRVFSERADPEFTASSGLDGQHSDWLIAGQIILDQSFTLDGRLLLGADGQPTRADGQASWQRSDIALRAAYVWQAADEGEDRPATVSEWTLDTTLDLSRAWTVGVDARYDVAAQRPVRAGLEVTWRNECVTVDLSASRRFASSTTVEPTTTFGISAELAGFSAGRPRGPAAACRN